MNHLASLRFCNVSNIFVMAFLGGNNHVFIVILLEGNVLVYVLLFYIGDINDEHVCPFVCSLRVRSTSTMNQYNHRSILLIKKRVNARKPVLLETIRHPMRSHDSAVFNR